MSRKMDTMKYGTIFGAIMFKIGLALLCMILAVGSIDGPTGHEMNNWGQCFAFMFAGLFFGIWGLMTGTIDE